ncbi:MAG: PEP-CTERM sorting domain-containing protein [Planctomycetaceae bacterium]|nr:PEP-CTERM sorting domain-containing protein [Planctomycetaceae bacterium]
MVSSFSAFNEPAFDTGLNVFGDLTFGSDATVQIYGDDDFFASLYDGWSYNLFSATGEVNGIDYLLANWSASSANEGFNFELRWNAELGLLTVTQAAIPEPATLAIVGLGLAGLGYARRRQMKRKAA